MENTLFNKAKFYAQYFGQTVIVLNGNQMTSVLDNIQEYVSNSHLYLKSIEEISNEQCLHIANEILTARKLISEEATIFQIKELLAKRWETPLSQFQWENIYSYLRSEGFLMSFNGLKSDELIEYGWVKTSF